MWESSVKQRSGISSDSQNDLKVRFKYLHVSNVLHISGVFYMVSMTLAIPREMKIEMDEHPEINWSEIARQAIQQKLVLLEHMDKLLAKSKLTEKDALELGRKVNKAVARKYSELS